MSNTESNLSHLRLELKQVCYSNSNSGFVVLKGRDCDRPDNGSTVTAVGVLPEVAQDPSRAVGEVYKLIGGWKTDPRYGTQYCFDLGYLAPNSELKHFLTKCISGLGESLSDALLNRYSEAELFDILDNTPEKLLDVKGIGPKKLEKIKESWAKKRCLHELSEYLLPVGATPNLVMRVYGHFGTHAVRIVRSNPYSITQVRGIGFKTADALAHKLGTSYNDINRIEAAIEYVLKMAAEEQGHTVLPLEMLLSKLKEILDTESQTVADDLIYEALAQLIQKNCVVVDEHGVSVKAYRQMEEWLHKAIKQRVETALPCAIATPEMVEIFLARMECEMGIVFSKHQKNVVHRLAVGDSMIYALLGYAGTGKTTISKVLLDFLAERFCPRDQIVCCAFTGIAARRVGTLTGYPSYTIHTLLRYRGEDSYVFNENNPLPYSVVLLDEAGMVNLPLFYSLMKALSPHTLFIMVGDPAQLPPIGSGNVFCDVTNWYKFPKTTLTEIHRQREDSILVHLANIVRQGEIPSGYANTYLDYKFIIQDIPNYYSLRKKLSEVEVKELRDRNNAMILQHIRKVVMELANDLENPVWDIQVLSPVRKGILGTEALNPVLQEILNPHDRPSISAYGIQIKEGDKVVHLCNRDMDAVLFSEGMEIDENLVYEKQRIFNGAVGVVQKADGESGEFFVLYPEGYLVRYEDAHIQSLVNLAYCLTVHKSQGGQYSHVVVPLSNSHYIMQTNKWFYTALTRAVKQVILIGQEYAYRRCCSNIDTTRRVTYLSNV